ncbi:MAG: Methyltransferase type 11 [Candidatus Brocadiaceae bacterium]|nr:Methyltransferase type 11 [Candidatus Brocadiaceae bacterium]
MKPGRNDPCPCGSGKKYKKCCHDKLEARVGVKPQQPAEAAAPGGSREQEIDVLVSLFNQKRYVEAEHLARSLTERFPRYGVGWKALGAVLKQTGRSSDALAPMRKAAALLPGDAEAHSNLGIVLEDLGHVDDAVASYRLALKIKPDFAEAHNNLGNALQSLRRLDEAEASYRRALDEAEASYRRALEINPDYAEAHNNLGNAFLSLGRLDEAEASYRRALEINPDYAEAHNNLGNAFLSLGRLDEAEASCLRALVIKPDFAEAYNNLGNALHGLGRLGEAEAGYLRALEFKPDYPEALNNLALLLNAQGKAIMALHVIKQSLRTKETAEARNVFVACVKNMRLTHDDSDIRIDMTRALTEPWGRPDDLARISTDLVKLNPEIEGCIARAAAAWPLRLPAQDLFGTNGLAMLAADPLLCALLVSAPICDLELERFLTMARRAMLQTAAGMRASDAESGTALNFYSALARQCFINEYVFSHTNDEIREAGNLRDSLVTALEAGIQAPPLWPIAVAAYFPLCSLPHAARLLDTEWPAEVSAVLVQQVHEPVEELQERTRIPRMTDVENGVSLSVQNQYEENPYPRWVKAEPAGNVKDFVGYLYRKFPLSSFHRHGKNGVIDVLIAGCGTGRHSIEVARHFQQAQVVAVDLSISSLSYARRKTRELGLTSIEYAQADLLKLGSLGRSFDVIESVGVLHHLADPWAGWRVLLSLLRPAGFMKLGLYSETARRHIVKARAFIAGQGYGATANEIRRCRQELTDMDKSTDFGTILKSSDFFTISTCRDLLFHVQEHCLTLTAIDVFLRYHQLTFLGFEIGDDVLNDYKLRFPDDPAATNLGQWQIFEHEKPDTFFGMYQFWIQKAG